MRLWHVDLLRYLPEQWLLGQHRECCALRGRGWGRPHATVNYVFEHDYFMLYQYHMKVMYNLINNYIFPNSKWFEAIYRGEKIGYVPMHTLPNFDLFEMDLNYPEHNDQYFIECCDNLIDKFYHKILKTKDEYWVTQMRIIFTLKEERERKIA